LPHGSEKDDRVKLPFQKRMYLVPAGCLVFILFFTVFGDRGLLRIYELRRENGRIEERLSNGRQENEKLKREIIALKSDRRYLESIARKDFGLVRSNEVIYQFPQEKK
jgi:cell division protein FtsB